MVAELTPGTQEAGELEDGAADPDRPDAARRQPRRDPRRRSTATRAPTCSCCCPTAAQALGGNGRELANTIRRFEPTARDTAQDRRAARDAAREHQARHPQLLARGRRAGRQGRPARRVRRELQRGLRGARRARTRTCARRCRSCRPTLTRRRARSARPKTLADELGPTLEALRPGRPRARPGARADAPVPARDDADHPGRDPPVRARRAPGRQGAAAGAARPRRRSRPTCCATFKVVNTLLNTLAYNPPGDDGRGLPVLGLVGQPPRAGDLLQPGRARADPPRPRRGRLPEPADAREHRARQPAARRAHAAARGARPARRVPAVRAPPGAGAPQGATG